MSVLTINQGEFTISTDKEKLDIASIHQFLSVEAYWSRGIPLDKVKRSIEHSLCFGVYHDDRQIGFARVISDFTTIAYLGDVYIIEDYRGEGLSKWLLKTVMEYAELQGLRRWILLTQDAHELYRQFGWTAIADASKWMELHNKNVYPV